MVRHVAGAQTGNSHIPYDSMKKVLLPLSLLAFAAACGDSSLTSPAATVGPEILGPSFDLVGSKDGDLDAVAKVMPLNVSGANGTTTLYVQPTSGDGKNGCNLTGQTTLTVSVSSSQVQVATVSPSSVTFASCGDVNMLTITPVAQGTATISITQTSNTTGGTFDLSAATFTVNVAPSANTAPKLSITGVTEGNSYAKGSVPVATCEVADAEDGNKSFAATLSAVEGDYKADGIGSQTANCIYTDAGGLTVSSSKTYGIADPTAPTITYTLTPASPKGKNGWYNSDVALTWTVDDLESPKSLAPIGCEDQKIEADQKEQTYSCSAKSAGGTTGPKSVSIKRDATAPTISGSRLPAANDAGWNNTDVVVSFSCADSTSGVATCSAPSTLNSEGANQSVTGNATDNAGNTDATSVSGINIDRTLPTVSLVGGPADGSSYYFGEPIPAKPTCTASDLLSGLDGNCSVGGYSVAVGTHIVTATATDKAGNTSTKTATYTVMPWTPKGFYQPTDMDGVVNTVKAGATVPLKFEVFVGDRELTDVSAIGSSYKALVTNCTVDTPTDDIEAVSTGGTSLRYDPTAGQFIQNWQTPKQVGACYRVTVSLADGSNISALFKLK